MGPSADLWLVKTQQGPQALPLGYMVSFVCSGNSFVGEVIIGDDNGPALCVKREGSQRPVCTVSCAQQRGSFWQRVADAVQADCKKRNAGAGHTLTGPGIWGMGKPHAAFRAFMNDKYKPSEHVTLHQIAEAAQEHIDINDMREQGWFVVYGQSGSTVAVAHWSPVIQKHDRAIFINGDMSWSVNGLSHVAPKTSVMPRPPSKMHPSLLGPLIDKLANCRICPGNPESKFREVTDIYKNQALLSTNPSQYSAKVEEEAFV